MIVYRERSVSAKTLFFAKDEPNNVHHDGRTTKDIQYSSYNRRGFNPKCSRSSP